MDRKNMIHSDFYINGLFYTAAGRWRCTDVGTRIVAAIHLPADGPPCYPGPPYTVAEFVFDEYDMDGCIATYAEASEEFGEEFANLCRETEPKCACVEITAT
jgi:hypothetical protein